MKASLRFGRIPGIISKVVVIFLVISLFVAIYPQPAQAACSFKYTVQSGDSLYYIATTFGVKFDDLVSLNKLKEPYIIYVGQVLCMPPGAVKPVTTAVPGTTTTTAKKVPTISGIHLGSILWVGVTNFPKTRFYYVNVYPEMRHYYTYPSYKIGMLQTDKNGQFGAWFHMPSIFEEEWRITICLKDVINDDVISCAKVTNHDYFLYK